MDFTGNEINVYCLQDIEIETSFNVDLLSIEGYSF